MNKVTIVLPLDVVYSVRKRDGKESKFILNLNNYRNTHRRILHDAKIAYEAVVTDLIPEDAKELLYGRKIRIAFKYYPASARLIDVSNPIAIIEKFAVDAIVKAGVIEDDNFNIITGSDGWEYMKPDKINPRCEMTLYTVDT